MWESLVAIGRGLLRLAYALKIIEEKTAAKHNGLSLLLEGRINGACGQTAS